MGRILTLLKSAKNVLEIDAYLHILKLYAQQSEIDHEFLASNNIESILCSLLDNSSIDICSLVILVTNNFLAGNLPISFLEPLKIALDHKNLQTRAQALSVLFDYLKSIPEEQVVTIKIVKKLSN
mmetsp:Transcript_3187/g.2659  ORF Transcript_3187/g.2659 Transcript_3187/m.2659 type:complete len:125 (+) Transcript_3187:946-1320(+)